MKLFNLAFRIFRRDLHSVGIIGAPFSKGQVSSASPGEENAVGSENSIMNHVTVNVLQQPRDGVQLGPDVIREAGLVKRLEAQGNTATVLEW